MSEDFSGQNLRGRSFAGQDLTGATFSGADIRGTSFARAILVGADFSNIRAGQQSQWLIGLIIGVGFLASLAGFISAYAGAFVGSLMIMVGNPEIFWSSIIAVIVLIVFIAVTIRQGLGIALGALAVTLAAGVAVFAALIQQPDFIAVAIIQSLGIASAIAGAIVGAIALATAWMIAKQLVPLTIIFTIVGAVPGALEGVGALSNSPDSLPKNAIPVALLINPSC